MSIANYVINWDELESLLSKHLSNIVVKDLSSVRGESKVKGFTQSIMAVSGDYEVFNWTVPYDVAFTGLTYAQSAYKVEDAYSLFLNEECIFDNLSTKELGESKSIECIFYLRKGDTLKLVHHNNSGNSKIVWSDVEYVELLEAVPK